MIIKVQPNDQRKIKDLSIISNDKKRKLSKTLTVFFIIIQFVFFLDYGFIEYQTRNKKILFKCLNILVGLLYCLFMVFTLFNESDMVTTIWFTTFVIEYFFHLLILALSNNSLCNLLKDLIIIDEAMDVDTRIHHLEVKIIASILSLIIFKSIYSVIYCTYFKYLCISPNYAQLMFMIFQFGLDIGLLVFFFVFYVVYCRMKKFVALVNKSDMKIIHCEYIYKSLINSMQVTKGSFDGVFTLTILFHIPTVMVIIYYTLKEYKTSQQYMKFSYQYVAILQELLQLFAPALAAEWISAQVDEMKMVLHNKLLLSEDEDTSQELIRFLRYIDARPFNFSVYRLIPLNYTLPIIVLDICITYLIVTIQLTHLY